MMVPNRYPLLIQTAGLLGVALLLCALVPAAAAQEEKAREEVLAIARSDERVSDLLADVEGLRLDAYFAEQYDVWMVEILHPERGEVGFLTLSLEQGEVLEFSVDRGRLFGDDAAEEEAPGLSAALAAFVPQLHGANLAWVSFLLSLLLAANLHRLGDRRNADVVLLYLLCPFLLLMWTHTQLAYTGIFAVTLLLFGRALWVRSEGHAPPDTLSLRGVQCVAVAGVLLHAVVVLTRPVGDVGIWSNLGAGYWLQSGHLPYGTAFGSNCVYGPLMYALFLPAAWLVPPALTLTGGQELQFDYHAMSQLGVQATVMVLDAVTLILLFYLASAGDAKRRWTVLALYALSPYLLGLVSEMGLERASQVVAMPFLLGALALRKRAFVGGLLLGVATGMVYYPLFLAPLWLHDHWRRDGWKAALRFAAGSAAVGVLCLLLIAVFVEVQADRGHDSALRAFWQDTIYQQQWSESYGNSPLSFWGQYPALAEWGKPLTTVLYGGFCLGWLIWPKPLNGMRLVGLSASVLIGFQLILSHGGGTYIGCYYGLLILALYGGDDARQTSGTGAG